MHQKYLISRDGNKHQFKIKEYAVIDKVFKKGAAVVLSQDLFSFIGEETYADAMIQNSIPEGIDAVVKALRTDNMFPIAPHATKIAESVMTLYASTEEDAIELFFNDVDLFQTESVV